MLSVAKVDLQVWGFSEYQDEYYERRFGAALLSPLLQLLMPTTSRYLPRGVRATRNTLTLDYDRATH